MFFLCYVPFHLTAPFHATPWGPESGDLVVHVTVIIFFNGDKDMDSSDCACSLSSPALTLILFGDSVSVLDRKWIQPKQSKPILCTETRVHTEPYCVCTPKTYTLAQIHMQTETQRCRDTAVRKQQTNVLFSGATFAGLNTGWGLEIVAFFPNFIFCCFYDPDSAMTFSVYIPRRIF